MLKNCPIPKFLGLFRWYWGVIFKYGALLQKFQQKVQCLKSEFYGIFQIMTVKKNHSIQFSALKPCLAVTSIETMVSIGPTAHTGCLKHWTFTWKFFIKFRIWIVHHNTFSTILRTWKSDNVWAIGIWFNMCYACSSSFVHESQNPENQSSWQSSIFGAETLLLVPSY